MIEFDYIVTRHIVHHFEKRSYFRNSEKKKRNDNQSHAMRLSHHFNLIDYNFRHSYTYLLFLCLRLLITHIHSFAFSVCVRSVFSLSFKLNNRKKCVQHCKMMHTHFLSAHFYKRRIRIRSTSIHF